MLVFLVSCIVFVLILILIVVCDRAENFTMMTSVLDHKSKCFDCEKEMINRFGIESAWMAQPTKSFDAESDLIRRMKDIRGGYGAKTLKYY